MPVFQIRCKDVQGDKPPTDEYAKRSNHQDDQDIPGIPVSNPLGVARQDAEHEEEKFSSAFRLFRTVGTAASVENLGSTTSSKFGHRLCASSLLQDAETQAYSRFFQYINVIIGLKRQTWLNCSCIACTVSQLNFLRFGLRMYFTISGVLLKLIFLTQHRQSVAWHWPAAP